MFMVVSAVLAAWCLVFFRNGTSIWCKTAELDKIYKKLSRLCFYIFSWLFIHSGSWLIPFCQCMQLTNCSTVSCCPIGKVWQGVFRKRLAKSHPSKVLEIQKSLLNGAGGTHAIPPNIPQVPIRPQHHQGIHGSKWTSSNGMLVSWNVHSGLNSSMWSVWGIPSWNTSVV